MIQIGSNLNICRRAINNEYCKFEDQSTVHKQKSFSN